MKSLSLIVIILITILFDNFCHTTNINRDPLIDMRKISTRKVYKNIKNQEDDYCEEEPILTQSNDDNQIHVPIIKTSTTNLFVLADQKAIKFKNRDSFTLKYHSQEENGRIDLALKKLIRYQLEQQKLEHDFLNNSYKNSIIAMPSKNKISYVGKCDKYRIL